MCLKGLIGLSFLSFSIPKAYKFSIACANVLPWFIRLWISCFIYCFRLGSIIISKSSIFSKSVKKTFVTIKISSPLFSFFWKMKLPLPSVSGMNLLFTSLYWGCLMAAKKVSLCNWPLIVSPLAIIGIFSPNSSSL